MLGSRELYQMQISQKYKKPSLQLHYIEYFNNFEYVFLQYVFPTANVRKLKLQIYNLPNIIFKVTFF